MWQALSNLEIQRTHLLPARRFTHVVGPQWVIASIVGETYAHPLADDTTWTFDAFWRRLQGAWVLEKAHILRLPEPSTDLFEEGPGHLPKTRRGIYRTPGILSSGEHNECQKIRKPSRTGIELPGFEFERVRWPDRPSRWRAIWV